MKTNQEIMNELFPNANVYPNNSLTPTIVYYEGDQTELVFLIKGEYDLISDFVHEEGDDGKVLVESTLYTEPNSKGLGLDLIIRLDFHYDNPNGNPIFEAEIYGDSPEAQIEICKALKHITRYHVFIATSGLELVKFKVFNWDAHVHMPVLDKITRGGDTH